MPLYPTIVGCHVYVDVHVDYKCTFSCIYIQTDKATQINIVAGFVLCVCVRSFPDD
jgi:hypothetical protein